jgi:hypothetical protein
MNERNLFLKKGFLSCSFPKNFSCEKNLPQKAEGSFSLPKNDSFWQWVFFFVKLFSFSEKKKV